MINFILKITYPSLMFLILVVFLFANGPWLESKFAPVTANTEITKVVGVDKTHVRIIVEFSKNRTCTFEQLTWYQIDSITGRLERVRHVMEDDNGETSSSRPEGKQRAGPWLLEIDINSLDKLVAIAKHSCHPFWDTLTQFYPSEVTNNGNS